MSSPLHVDRQSFLRRLRRSELLGAEQLAALEDDLPDTDRGRVVARALVERGALTRFQAEQLMAGRTRGFLVGPYRVLEQLGSGGMGCVFKAEHRETGHVVALKAIAPRLLKNKRALKFFRREVSAVSRLEHPHIVKALDADRDGDRHYLVMEYVDGPNLDQLVRSQGPLPVGQACEFVCQAAEALEYARGLGLVHRDIKPANLLLEAAPVATAAAGGDAGAPAHASIKITDFGLARLGAPEGQPAGDYGTILTRANTVMGTPDFIAPEQARSLHKADIRSDLYSLGCTFYFLLTGKVPFPGGATLEKLVRHSIEEPTPVEELRPEVPREVAKVVRRLMAKDPDARYPTPADAAEALRPFRADAPVAFPPVRPSDVGGNALPTPVGDEGVPSDPEGTAGVSDAESALAGTLTADASSTPAPTAHPTTSGPAAPTRPPTTDRWFFTLLAVAALGGGLLFAVAARLLWP